MMEIPINNIATKVKSPPLSLQEYFVDFLGGLVPGMLFIVAAFFGLIPPLYALGASLSRKHSETIFFAFNKFLRSIQQTPSAIWIVLFLGAALFAYIVGHLFYRHDPKKPDRKSFKRLVKSHKYKDPEEIKKNLGCINDRECEFPYPNYDEYLDYRGLKHLLPFVIWKGEPSWRSKVYINLLKIRLRYYFPEKCSTIIRNEAHVRLASSTWYVSSLLIWFGVVGLLIAGISFFISYNSSQFETINYVFAWHLPSILAPLSVLILSSYFRWTIQKFIHYQRMREVFFVLETAYTAFKRNIELLSPFSDKFNMDSETSNENR